MGVLDVGEELAPMAHEVEPPPQEISRRPHLGRVDVGLGNQAAPQERGGLLGVDLVVLGLGPVDGLHVEGVAEDEGDALLGAEVRQPVPGEDALHGDHEVVAVGGDRPQEALRIAGEVAVEEHLALLVEDADVHGSRVQVDSAVVLVCFGVESHGSLL